MNEQIPSINDAGKDLKQYRSPGDAKAQIAKDFNDWSSILSQNSVQASFAIIAANWAVHGDTGKILSNVYAKTSIVMILVFLGVNLTCSYFMSHLHYERYLYAEDNSEVWKNEYDISEKLPHWPYTATITYIGSSLRLVKMLVPIIATIFLIVSLF